MSLTTLVSTEQLAAHAAEWAIVDCRFDLANENWGREQYAVGHVPGAVYASLNDDLSAPRTGTNGRHPLPSQDAIVATVQRLGIDNGTQVVVYDQDSGLYAGRLWWLLRYAGHETVALLDGGFAKWTAEGRPVRAGVETRPRSTFRPAFDAGMHVTVDEVARRAADGRTLLVDARGADRFAGRNETIDPVAGHVPGARNMPFAGNLGADGKFLSPERLRQRWNALLGSQPPTSVIAMCGSGVTACQNLLALEHAGLGGGRLYAGSWSEWIRDPRRPVVGGTY